MILPTLFAAWMLSQATIVNGNRADRGETSNLAEALRVPSEVEVRHWGLLEHVCRDLKYYLRL